jgi:hypothetical protein
MLAPTYSISEKISSFYHALGDTPEKDVYGSIRFLSRISSKTADYVGTS